jgi:aldehyde:ferredoxin oxidoreductase
VKEGKYATAGHKPEYETLGAFGTLCLNNSLESIVKINDICNRAGLDTIGTGATVAFALECYENRLISAEDAGGMQLTWGNDEAIVSLTEQIARDEGVGKIFSNGIASAARTLGEDRCAPFAMHVGGEELAMHDARLNPGIATSYQIEATPGRHTQGGSWLAEAGFVPAGAADYFAPFEDKYTYTGKGDAAKYMSCLMHVVNAAGMCTFGAMCCPADAIPGFLSAVMGSEYSMDRVVETGWRIGSMRMAFSVREGVAPPKLKVPGRLVGSPALTAGPLKGVTVDHELQGKEFLDAMGWDAGTGMPTKDTLKTLGLAGVVK